VNEREIQELERRLIDVVRTTVRSTTQAMAGQLGEIYAQWPEVTGFIMKARYDINELRGRVDRLESRPEYRSTPFPPQLPPQLPPSSLPSGSLPPGPMKLGKHRFNPSDSGRFIYVEDENGKRTIINAEIFDTAFARQFKQRDIERKAGWVDWFSTHGVRALWHGLVVATGGAIGWIWHWLLTTKK
jgi:hypothetical protein